MFKRLKGASGQVSDQAENAGDSDAKIVRPAILVHSGAEGKAIVFESSDGEIAFDSNRIKNIVANQNKLITGLANEYGGPDKMPLGAHFPIKDEHENGSAIQDVIGRMGGLLKFEVRDVPGVGKNVACAISELTFLGKEIVDRVKDGRIFNLSVGINDNPDEPNYDTLNEVSAVIVPAAPGAMLLKRGEVATSGKTKQGVKAMPNLKRVQAHTKRLSVLQQMSEGLTNLSKKTGEAKDAVRLTKRTGEISHRLSGLMKAAKLTPAGFKQMDIKRLAALSDDALDTVFKTLEAQEPVIKPTQAGSTDAIDFATLSKNMKQKDIKNLKSEIKKDFKKLSGGKINMASDEDDDKNLGGGNKEHEINPGKDPHAVAGEEEVEMKKQLHAHMSAMGKHLADGNIDEAKKSHEAVMKHLEDHGDKHLAGIQSDVKSEDYQKGMSDLESKVDELSTQMARYCSMVNELMDVEKEEGHDLAKAEDEEIEKPGQASA